MNVPAEGRGGDLHCSTACGTHALVMHDAESALREFLCSGWVFRETAESLSETEAAYTRRCLLAFQAALPYHGDARSEFRFDGLRDPDTPAGQPSKSR